MRFWHSKTTYTLHLCLGIKVCSAVQNHISTNNSDLPSSLEMEMYQRHWFICPRVMIWIFFFKPIHSQTEPHKQKYIFALSTEISLWAVKVTWPLVAVSFLHSGSMNKLQLTLARAPPLYNVRWTLSWSGAAGDSAGVYIVVQEIPRWPKKTFFF